MPSKNSYSELILDFQELIRSTDTVPELLPSIEAERQVLVQVIADVERLRTRQAELTALKQRATQELREAIGGHPAASRQLLESARRGRRGSPLPQRRARVPQ